MPSNEYEAKLNTACASRVGHFFAALDKLSLIDDFVPMNLYHHRWLPYLPRYVSGVPEKGPGL